MKTSMVMVGSRVPIDWQEQIKELATVTGKKEAEIVRDAIARYLGENNPDSAKGAIADLQVRLQALEAWRQKLSG